MQGVLGVIHLILAIVAILDIVKSARDTLKKVLWILLALCVPLIGPIVYLVLGRGKK